MPVARDESTASRATAEVEPRMLLVHFLRDQLQLTGTHWGCDTSNCGTCVIKIDGGTGEVLHDSQNVRRGTLCATVEGMETDGTLDPVQEGFMQCRDCSAGSALPG